MSGGNGLHARHQHQGGGMKDDKDGTQLCGQWHRVCELAALPEQGGRSAWLEGRVLALFRLGEHVYALDGVDPLAGVAVLGRGLVGDAGGEPVVASPLYKQRYALMDGRCLDDPALSVACWPVRLEGSEVWVQLG
ncbi:nitrite reductase small subunit NirD [Aeromonas caviae]|uniref:nitrite reductase small subunit NirD n=1 Tax=Aeromonas caviae TaxID=648 RepID=UPI001F1A4B76|nr:nitrite reductase small subunit NirD [Aeromonas caviae]